MKQRIYIIGTGVISHHHANARKTWPRETELYAADPSPAARESFLKEFPDAIMFESSDEMLAHAPADKFDLVVVSTPPRFHCSEAIKALQSGRNVVCEKPFAMNMEEAERMVAEAKKLGLGIACCSNRFLKWGANLKTKELIQSGEIGAPYLVDFMHRNPCSRTGVDYQNGSWWFLSNDKNGGGMLMDWGPYDMSCLVDIFDPVKVTVSNAKTISIPIRHGVPDDVVFDIDTHASASLEFELADGQTVVIRYERGGCQHGEQYDIEGIYGTEGYIKWHWIPFQDQSRVAIRRSKAPGLVSEEVYPISPYTPEEDWMGAPLREMDRHIRGEDNKALVNERAIHPFSILRAFYDCYESGKPVTLDFN